MRGQVRDVRGEHARRGRPASVDLGGCVACGTVAGSNTWEGGHDCVHPYVCVCEGVCVRVRGRHRLVTACYWVDHLQALGRLCPPGGESQRGCNADRSRAGKGLGE